MNMQTTADDNESLIVNEVSKEVLNAFIANLSNLETSDGIVNLGNLTNLGSIALIGNDGQVVLLRATTQTKPLALLLTGALVEQTVCYTTYDATRSKGKRSCAHRDTTTNGVKTSVQVCLENNAFYDDVTKKNYYLECNPTQNYPNRALLFDAELFTDDSGTRRWRKVPGSPVLLDEK